MLDNTTFREWRAFSLLEEEDSMSRSDVGVAISLSALVPLYVGSV